MYREPRLSAITLALGGGLLVQSLGVVPYALLRRKLSFVTIAAVEIGSTAVGTCFGLVAAWFGAKYWSLVVLMTAGAMSGTVLLWVRSDWWPGKPGTARNAKALLEVSTNIARFSISNYFARNADNLLIGIWWGAEPLGVYSRAYAVMVAPVLQGVNGVAAVAMPTLSRLRDTAEGYRRYFSAALALVALVTIPVFLSLFLCSGEIVAVLLGPRWEQVGLILRVLGLAALFQPILSTCGWNYICCANTRRLRRWGLWSAGVTVSAFVLGLPWGPMGVAVGYAVAMNVLVLPGCLLAIRDTPLEMRDIWAAVKAPLAAGFAFLLFAATARYMMTGQRPIVVLSGSVSCGLLGMAAVVWRSRELRARVEIVRYAVLSRAVPKGGSLGLRPFAPLE
jgi:PST family polysaccharide transporter